MSWEDRLAFWMMILGVAYLGIWTLINIVWIIWAGAS